MASNYFVRIHLESYLKRYVINNLSIKKRYPVELKKNSLEIKQLKEKLISKREYEHKKIIEDKHIDPALSEYVDILLPWMKGTIDIRVKHYISPLAEKRYRQFLKDNFYFQFHRKYIEISMLADNTIHKDIQETGKYFGIHEDPNFDTVLRNYYRLHNLAFPVLHSKND